MVVRRALKLHPDSDCALSGIEVELVRVKPRKLEIRWVALGPVQHVKIPRPTRPERADELWKHTCFEAFVRAEDDESYFEVNVAPRGNWNAYRFSDYRTGMETAKLADVSYVDLYHRRKPLSEDHRSGLIEAGMDPLDRFVPPFFYVSALIDLERKQPLPVDKPWQIGLSAVIEENNGRKSYWALAHPPGPPDFHHEDCFALRLPAARPA